MFELRPYQQQAVKAVLSDLETYNRVGAILPTGGGKTEIFIDICARYTQANPTKSILILSHLSLLTEQTKARFNLRAPSLIVDVMQGQQKPKWNSSVIISTMQTSRSLKHAHFLRSQVIRQVGLIIIDEAHYLPTNSYQQILEHFPEAKVAGFTATPYRDRQIMTSHFDKVSYSISLQELIDMGYLVPPKIREIVNRGDTIEDILATVLHLYNTECTNKQAVVYMRTIDEARLLASAFQDRGVAARAVTQELVGDYRNDILEGFNNGRTKVLTTVNVLTAGFDSPRVDSIFMPYGTSSPTVYLQRIGRGLRLDKNRFKTECTVFVFGDAPHVAKKAAERLTKKILSTGGQPHTYATFREDFEYNDYELSSDIYTWNKTVVEAITKMEKLGMSSFAVLLNEKNFPQRFLGNIENILVNLPDKKTSLPHGNKPATEAQKTVLFKAGFSSKDVAQITKGEAHMMISTIFNAQNRSTPNDTKYIVREGCHAGKHVCELPFAYRSHIKKEYPDSPVAQLISAWEHERKKA